LEGEDTGDGVFVCGCWVATKEEETEVGVACCEDAVETVRGKEVTG
jgi:hypothetical protein